MSSQEHDPIMEEPVPGTDVELLARRDLAIRATEAIAEVLEVDVTVGALVRLSRAPEATEVRLAAKRALRCIESVAREDSAVVRAVGEKHIYHYVEGVIRYGASEPTYLGLMRIDRLSAAETTGLYALRQVIADEADGRLPGFPAIHRALQVIGMSPRAAVVDTDETVAALSEAGCFVDHVGGTTFNRPIFFPRGAGHLPGLGSDIDSFAPLDPAVWLRHYFETNRYQEVEE